MRVDRLVYCLHFKGGGKQGYIVAHDVFLGEETGKYLLRTQNVSEENQKHFYDYSALCKIGVLMGLFAFLLIHSC